jgi:hypothetical protein
MADASPWITLGAVIAGGSITVAGTYIIERYKERAARRHESSKAEAELATRWDAEFARISAEFVGTTRQVLHVARRLNRVVDVEDAKRRLDDHHAHLRSLSAQLGLFGSSAVAETARRIVEFAYYVRLLHEKTLPSAPPEDRQKAAYDRVIFEIEKFQVAVRKRLRMPDAEDVLDEAQFREERERERERAGGAGTDGSGCSNPATEEGLE